MLIPEPEYPAVADYPAEGPYSADADKAYKAFRDELASVEGWEDQGEREGVQLWRKPHDPEVRPWFRLVLLLNLPFELTNLPRTPSNAPLSFSTLFLATIQLPGLRKRWDSRMQMGHMLARYSRTFYEFYSELKGVSWLVYPRFLVAVTKTYREGGVGSEINLIQTSVEDPSIGEQAGKTRATLYFGGWQLKPQGDDLAVTYVVRIALNGSIPMALVNQIAVETPLCTGHARDVFNSVGHAPYVIVDAARGHSESGIIFQHEFFSDPTAGTSADERKYSCAFTTSNTTPVEFEFAYDQKRMFPGGVDASVVGEGVSLEVDEKEAKVLVKVEGGREGLVKITIQKKVQ
ncbi:Lipid-binding START containing protein [Pseudohyphozyma bogoriensis]|nr:Lipid-binding START containing protein [Pseudohyphozyma bogoriensis]